MYTRTIREFVVYFAVAGGMALAQAPPAAPVAFEVAAIRPAPPATELIQQVQSGKAKLGMTVEGNRVDIGFVSLADLVGRAYNVKPYEVQGPDWMARQRFDIQAKIPDGVSKDQVPEMLQALLAERFGMTIHKEKRDQPIYALIVGKNGPKLTEAAAEPDQTPPDSANSANPGTGIGQFRFSGNAQSGIVMQSGTMRSSVSVGPDGSGRLELNRITVPALANVLANYVDRPVIDMTGLAGEYRVTLDISAEDMKLPAQRAQQQVAQLGLQLPAQQPPGVNPDGASAPAGGSVFTAVDRLGLKLDARKAPMEVIVIDHLEKTPTEN